MFQQESIMASWGSMFNISSGRIIIDEQTFSLVPNVALTAMAMNLGTKAYSTQTFPIDAIIGYKQIFMAWMAILLNDGTKVKVSIGTKKKKQQLISALEARRNAIFASRGQYAPPLISVI